MTLGRRSIDFQSEKKMGGDHQSDTYENATNNSRLSLSLILLQIDILVFISVFK